MDDVYLKIEEILKQELNLTSLPSNPSQNNIPEWDSISYMSIVGRIESEFGVDVTAENIQKFNSISSIIQQING